jgi:hypothetical protein
VLNYQQGRWRASPESQSCSLSDALAKPGSDAPLVLLADTGTTAGAGTEEMLYQTPAQAIAREVGALRADASGAANDIYPRYSGLEAHFYHFPPIRRANV